MNITIPEDSIEILNSNKKYTYEIDPLTVKVRGLRENLDSIELHALIDVDELEEGSHQINAVIDNKHVVGNYKAFINIEEKK